ncbi:hydrogenase nickel incorporation protein HypB [Vibrio sonorensis]|uniref:hydrogenase nickel incorporation protein HypB n=1 Tax=Vibrio sonorensis TaxID=1004316 RepID=UPI0008DA2E6F|nr:hydrogenase nickel incorporation protein HypB [Vibrio sonorensis]
MCTTCGCANSTVLIDKQQIHSHDAPRHHSRYEKLVYHHYHAPVSIHYHLDGNYNADRSFNSTHTNPKGSESTSNPAMTQSSEHSHASGLSQSRMVQIEQDIHAKNDAIASKNRAFLVSNKVNTFNLLSSPGAGKTSLLTETLLRLGPQTCAVIEGDQQTSNDADRIRATGTPAVQINTGKGCHLDADMVSKAITNFDFTAVSTLFIENVGNLVCPAAFDLGETHKVVILSTTEGEDKPLKYPDVFANAQLMIINKIDLLPHLDFNSDTCIANAQRVNPDIQTILLSAKSGEGMEQWLNWLDQYSHGKE